MADQEQQPEPSRRRPRVIFDTGAVLQGALNPTGPASRALSLLDSGAVEVLLSPRIRSEYEDVLRRPAIREKFPRLTDEMIDTALDRFDTIAQLVPNPPRHVEYARDPKDEPLLNLAIDARADFLVTRDRDLLDLAEDEAVRNRFRFLSIVDPVSFVERMSGLTDTLQQREQEPET